MEKALERKAADAFSYLPKAVYIYSALQFRRVISISYENTEGEGGSTAMDAPTISPHMPGTNPLTPL